MAPDFSASGNGAESLEFEVIVEVDRVSLAALRNLDLDSCGLLYPAVPRMEGDCRFEAY